MHVLQYNPIAFATPIRLKSSLDFPLGKSEKGGKFLYFFRITPPVLRVIEFTVSYLPGNTAEISRSI